MCHQNFPFIMMRLPHHNEREILRLDEKGERGFFATKSKEKLVVIC